MSSSKEVFALRKVGALDDAYQMALIVIKSNPQDEWNIKALAWCLYDLIKRSVSQNDYKKATIYLAQLEHLHVDESDEILFKSINQAKLLASPEKKIILEAKEKSRLGQHEEAMSLFTKAIVLFPNDLDLNTQLAWELQKEGKIIFEKEKVDVQQARKLLADYMKLKNERPSQLHSIFLRFADKITDRVEFNLISFLKLWNLNNLREEDFIPFTKDGKTYPSIAEKIIQHASKLILDTKLINEVDYFIPYLDIGIKRFGDNIWLPYYKSKLLHLINRNEEAIEFLVPVVKEKITDYWTWSLLAELLLESDKEKAFSCYCKSLLCNGEDKFISNVRIKFAELLIQRELWSEAKFEIQNAIRAKETEGAKVSESLKGYQQKEWYINAKDKDSNNDLYYSHTQSAEEFIFHSLPWLDSSLSETFIIPENPNKPRRKVFIRLPKEIIEVSISDRRFKTSKNFKPGDGVRIKGEYDKEKVFKIYLLEKRNTQDKWDMFDWNNGNIVQSIKNDGNKITAWRVSALVKDKLKEGIIDIENVTLKMPIIEGMPIKIKLFQKEQPRSIFLLRTQKETRVNILSLGEREGEFWDTFPEQVGVIDHINQEKGIAHFIVSKKVSSIIKINQVNEKLEIGTKLLVRLKLVTKGTDSYYTVLTCSTTQQEASEEILASFEGTVKLSGLVGFADDVYIESNLVRDYDLKDGSFVVGMSILNYNKKKSNWGWKAIIINSVVS